MGSKDTDSFSKASVDLINQFLYERRGEMVCIIAGYERELEQSFFSINPGLKRRFAWNYYIRSYKAEELFEMFKRKVLSSKWSLSSKAETRGKEIFKNNLSLFPNTGGDVENFFTSCRVHYSRRMFLDGGKEKVLTHNDLKGALEGIKSNKNNKPKHLPMYN
jgi:hypothetical protein